MSDDLEPEDLSARDLDDDGIRRVLESEPYGVLSMCEEGTP